MKKLFLYSVAKTLLSDLLEAVMNVKVLNEADEYDGEGGVIFCANHINMLDCLVLAIAVDKRQIRFLAKKELFGIPLVSSLISSLGAYGVDRKSADVKAIKKTIVLLSEGACVGIFPQGTRHPETDPKTTEFKSGAVMAAYHAQVPIQPVFIRTEGRKFGFFKKKEVIFGEVLSYNDLGFTDGERADYHAATEILKERLVKLEYEYEGGAK